MVTLSMSRWSALSYGYHANYVVTVQSTDKFTTSNRYITHDSASADQTSMKISVLDRGKTTILTITPQTNDETVTLSDFFETRTR